MTNKCKIDLGTINFNNTGKRHRVIIEIELRNNDGKNVLSICGNIMTANNRGFSCGGQCYETINLYKDTMTENNRKLWEKIYFLWTHYHLNDMHAGTKKQEKAIKNYLEKTGKRYDYSDICEYLKSINLYEDNYNGELYKYGHGWLYEPIKKEDLNTIKTLIDIFK